MSHVQQVIRVALMAATFTAGAITGPWAGSALAQGYICVEVFDPQGHVIDTVCAPDPRG